MSEPVQMHLYGGAIEVFFAEIHNQFRGAAPIGLDDSRTLSLKRIMDQREKTPFPDVPRGGGDDTRAAEANRLIHILNHTENIKVFRIAVNAILFVIQGKVSYRPCFEGEAYAPNRLMKALEEVEETELA
jgi:hypothetical protein